MALAIVCLLGGFLVLTIGAEALVRGAASLALRLGISPLAIGLTVVAFGTSAPELVVCVRAAVADQAGMALGNVVGSNIFNIAAILGVVALVYPIRCQLSLIRREIPIMIGAGVLLLVLALFEGLPRTESGSGVITRLEGGFLLFLGVLYTGVTYWLARRDPEEAQGEFANDVVLGESAVKLEESRWWVSVIFVLVGLCLLVWGADLLVKGVVMIARRLGASDLVIGLTIVGAGTSLPELATSVVAAVRKEPDIALGNVVGSSIFNILLILGVTCLVQPLDVERVVLTRDLPVMLFAFLICLPIAITGRHISRGEGAVFLSVYLGYLAYLIV